jgi:hypothetical protein
MPLAAETANNMAEKPNTEPTERSNSPAIIKKVTPAATIPNSEAIVTIPENESIVRNLVAVKENPIKTITKPTKAPNSG